MAYLALRAAEANVSVHLRSGFWVTSSLLAAVTVVQVNVWRARGGGIRDVLADRFAAGLLIALAWTFSFWLLFLIDVTEVEVPRGTVGTFATGLVVGASAGFAAPPGRRARLLFAAAAPVVLVLSGWPLTLPIVVIVGVALRRVLCRSSSRWSTCRRTPRSTKWASG